MIRGLDAKPHNSAKALPLPTHSTSGKWDEIEFVSALLLPLRSDLCGAPERLLEHSVRLRPACDLAADEPSSEILPTSHFARHQLSPPPFSASASLQRRRRRRADRSPPSAHV